MIGYKAYQGTLTSVKRFILSLDTGFPSVDDRIYEYNYKRIKVRPKKEKPFWKVFPYGKKIIGFLGNDGVIYKTDAEGNVINEK